MWRRVVALVAAVLAIVGTAVIVGTTTAQSAAAPTLTTLGLDVVPGLSQLAPTGATAPSTGVEIDVALSGSNAAAEASYLKGLYTVGSANYHEFLTTQQVAADYGTPASDLDAALAYSTAQGLSVVRTSNTGELIVLTGTVAQAEKTFGVTIDNFAWHGLNFYANVNAPSVPSGLGITGVVGLNTAQVMHTDQTDCEGSVCLGATTPQDLWSTYDQPSSDEGQGQSVAIFGEGDWTPPLQDLRLFETANDLPAVPARVVEVDGAKASYTDTAGDEEWDIDTQASTGMAPDLQQLDLYFGTSLDDADVLNVVDDWASDPNGPLQASASYGECEYDPVAQDLPSGDDFAMGQATEVAYEAALQHANLEGRTLFSSAGDDGSSCPILPVDTNGVATQAFPDVNYPCASPEVVCVGGTVLYTTGDTPNSRSVEYGWNDSGGGTSLEFPEPSWQSALNGTGTAGPGTFDCLYTDAGALDTTPTTCRSVPDIAAQSGDIATNGYGIYYDGSPTEEGGTSLSSPLSLGMWARVQSAAPAVEVSSGGKGHKGHGAVETTYPGLGFADPTFYAHESDFYDIGNPSDTPPSPPTSNGYFVSGPGWDYVTGLGVIDVTKLTQAVDGKLTPTDNVASPNSQTITYVDGSGYTAIPAAAPVLPACVSLFTGSPGESVYPPDVGSDYPQLDVLAGNMHNTATTLTGILTVEDMETGATAVPPGGTAIEYYFFWTYNNTKYFLNAEVAATGTTYNYGNETTGTTNSLNTVGSATGSIVTGTDGTITMSVPLTDIGSPTTGTELTAPSSETSVLEGAPSNPAASGGEVFTASTVGPDYPYTLGEVCSANGQYGSDGDGGAAT
jgi:pseudomonalisin